MEVEGWCTVQEIFGWSSTVLKSLGLDVCLTFGLWEL